MAARERRENSRVGLVDANVPQLVEGRRLKEFFECIPRSSGVFKSIKVTLTCIDASDEFLVVGSDAGQVFVYERERKRSGVLAEEGRSNSVSCVKLSESESEHRSRVAFGCKSGFVFIFQIQRRQEEYRDHPLRTFRLDRDHTAPVTCMTWHKDGQILISGDKMGKIFISSVDMAKNTCSIQLLHKAGSSVVQLSAGVTEEWIVMSDLERSFLLSLDPDSKRCIPVGQRDRKSGPFGACLIMSDREMVYVSRPGLRIWKADFCGKVSATLEFRDSLNSGQAPVIQMNSVQSCSSEQCMNGQFCDLHLLANKYIVTHCNNNLWVLDPDNNRIIGCHGELGRIIDIATTQTKIYLLREDAESPILVITLHPSTLPTEQPPLQNHQRDTAQLRTYIKLPSQSPSKLDVESMEKKIVSNHRAVVHEKLEDDIGDQVSHQPILECSPPENNGLAIRQSDGDENNLDLRPRLKRERFDRIGEAKFEDVLYNPKEKKKKKKHKKTEDLTGSVEYSKPNEPDISFVNFEESLQTSNEDAASSGKGSLDMDGEIDDVTSKQSGQTKASGMQTEADKELMSQTGKESLVDSEIDKSQFDKQSRKSSADEDDTNKGFSVENNLKSPAGMTIASTSNGETSLTNRSPVTTTDINQQNNIADKLLSGEESETDKCSPNNSAENNMTSLGDGNTIQPLIVAGINSTPNGGSHQSVYDKFKPGDDDVGDKHEEPRIQIEDLQKSIYDRFKPGDDDVGDEYEEPRIQSEDLQKSIYDRFKPGDDDIGDEHEGPGIQSEDSQKSIYDRFKPGDDDVGGKHEEPRIQSEDLQKSIYDRFKPGGDDMDDEDEEAGKNSEEHEDSIPTPGILDTAAVSLPPSQLATLKDSVHQGLIDSWTLCPLPPTIKPPIKWIDVSNTHMFVVDQGYCMFMTKTGEAAGKWQIIDGSGNVKHVQVSVSPNGLHIYSVSSKDQLHVRLGVTASCPAGEKWDKIADDITCIAVDDNQMWAVKKNGNVVHATILSSNDTGAPTWNYVEDAIGQSLVFVQVTTSGGVLWARDKTGSVYYRDGISVTNQQGRKWVMISGLKAMSICIGGHKAGWVVSTDGTTLFRQGVTPETPAGESKWWEILLSDDQADNSDASLVKSLLSWVKPSDSSVKMVVANAKAGVYVLVGNSSIYLSNTALLGSYFEVINLQGVPPSAANWLCVAAGSLTAPTKGLVWALRRNGDIFCLPPSRRPFSVDPPDFKNLNLSLLTASGEAVWALMDNSHKVKERVRVREGINCQCPEGASWKVAVVTSTVPEYRLAEVRWLACGKRTVWAIDRVGRAWPGQIPVQSPYTKPTWKLINDAVSEGYPLKQVAVAPNDSMVWAIDTKGNVYARTGILESLPIGNGWEYIDGVQAKDLAVSETSIWVLSTSEELFQRLGVSQRNCSGNCWRKVIGNFCHISVTPFDQLWGIKKDGQMYARHTSIYLGSQFSK